MKEFVDWALSVWPILLVLGGGAAAFSGWVIKHDFNQRKKENQQSLVLTPHTYAIGLSDMTGYPKEPENAAWLLLEVAVNAIGNAIDTLDLIIDGKTIPADHWSGKIVTAFNVYFNVTEWQYKGKNQVELIAHVGDKMYRSGRITIDFNVEPWGSHRI